VGEADLRFTGADGCRIPGAEGSLPYFTARKILEERMKVEYDPKHDIMNIELVADAPITESMELEDGVILDYSENKKIVSIEILGVKKRLSPETSETVSFAVVRES
jgi:uncharacterized protein YuzE